MTLRSLAEAVTHRFVFRRRLPPPYQQFRIFVSSESGLRYLKPRLTNVDPSLLRLVTEFVQPGHTVWDIGANVGLFAFTAARRAGPTGRVVAVEADTWNVALLRRSAELSTSAAAPVDVVPTAVSDGIGIARFNIAVRSRSTNHLEGYGSTQTGGVRETHLVPTVTLDHLLNHFPRLMSSRSTSKERRLWRCQKQLRCWNSDRSFFARSMRKTPMRSASCCSHTATASMTASNTGAALRSLTSRTRLLPYPRALLWTRPQLRRSAAASKVALAVANRAVVCAPSPSPLNASRNAATAAACPLSCPSLDGTVLSSRLMLRKSSMTQVWPPPNTSMRSLRVLALPPLA